MSTGYQLRAAINATEKAASDHRVHLDPGRLFLDNHQYSYPSLHVHLASPSSIKAVKGKQKVDTTYKIFSRPTSIVHVPVQVSWAAGNNSDSRGLVAAPLLSLLHDGTSKINSSTVVVSSDGLGITGQTLTEHNAATRTFCLRASRQTSAGSKMVSCFGLNMNCEVLVS